jgi:hypothetical protein
VSALFPVFPPRFQIEITRPVVILLEKLPLPFPPVTRVEYNDSDWPTIPEGEAEAHKEVMNDSNRIIAAGDASMMVCSLGEDERTRREGDV